MQYSFINLILIENNTTTRYHFSRKNDVLVLDKEVIIFWMNSVLPLFRTSYVCYMEKNFWFYADVNVQLGPSNYEIVLYYILFLIIDDISLFILQITRAITFSTYCSDFDLKEVCELLTAHVMRLFVSDWSYKKTSYQYSYTKKNGSLLYIIVEFYTESSTHFQFMLNAARTLNRDFS